MIAFVTTAFFLLAAAVAIVLWPLLRRPADPVLDQEVSNLDIHRDQFSELGADLESGVLGAERYEQAKNDLQRRVLEEAAAPAAIPRSPASGKVVPIAIGVFIPLTAILLYLHLGNLPGVVAPPHAAAGLSSLTAEEFKDMTAKLAARMQQHPDDAEGWKMLGRAYRAVERFDDANAAFKRAVEIKPQDADLLADYAESLALAAGRSLAGEPTRLLDRAMKLDPQSTKVLTLAGSAAFERRDYKAAIGYWGTVLEQSGTGSELAQALQKGIEESKARLAGKPVPDAVAGKERVTGSVDLDAPLKTRVQPEDTVFVFARAAQGPRVPLAIVKIKVADLPYQFSFDDSSAMVPDMKLSRFNEVVIGARVSKTGGAKPLPGDLEGTSAKIKPGRTGVVVTIDRAVAGS